MHRLGTKRLVALGAFAVASSLCLAAPGAHAVGSASPAPAIKVTQTASDAVTALNSVACGNAANTAENHYYRRFDLSGGYNAAQGFKVSQVSFGVENATSADNTIPGNVLVWAIDPADAFTLANLEPVATVPVNLDSAADGGLLTVPVTATVPAGKDMVLEVEVDAATTGKLFYIGSNTANQSGLSYLRAPACAINEPTPTSGIGFPTMHIVLFANGKAGECITAETAVDTATAALTTATANKTKATAAVASATTADAAAKKAVSKAKAKLKKAKKSGDASKIKKAKKKVKKAKAAAKKAAAALTAANTALTAATTAVTTATTAVTTATATATTECAQPTLPTRPASDSGATQVKAPGFVTAAS